MGCRGHPTTGTPNKANALRLGSAGQAHLHWAPQHAARVCRRHQQLLAQASNRTAARYLDRLVHEYKAADRQSVISGSQQESVVRGQHRQLSSRHAAPTLVTRPYACALQHGV